MPDQLANQGIRLGSGETPAATFIDHKRHATYRQAFAIDYRDDLESVGLARVLPADAPGWCRRCRWQTDGVISRAQVLFIGGRAGVGKTSIAAELHAQLAADRIQHCLIEGDNLDQAWPTPWERGLQLAELNLAAMGAPTRRPGTRE